MEALFLIIEAFFGINMPTYDYFLEKYFETNCICCFVCDKCRLIHRCSCRHKKFTCFKCGDNIYNNYFYYSSFIQYLKEKMEDSYFKDSLKYYKTHQSTNGIMKDFYDGFVFQIMKKKYFPKENENDLNLALIYNTDGVSVNKSASLWPFFLSIVNVSREKRKNLEFNHIFSICEKAKEEYIMQAIQFLMVTELLILQNGIEIQDLKVKAFLMCVLVDLPARSKVLLQKQFNGYDSCCFCDQQGVSFGKGQIRFPLDDTAIPRTKNSICADAQTSHDSFEGFFCFFLVFSIVSDFNFFDLGFSQLFKLDYFTPDLFCAVDFMHCVLLGITKRLMKALKSEAKKKTAFHITDKYYDLLEQTVIGIKLPANMKRKITQLKNIKAIDCFNIIIFCWKWFDFVKNGFPNLLELLREITIHSFSQELRMDLIPTIQRLCLQFVAQFEQIMGKDQMTHNLHLMTHLAKDLMLFGPCWTHIMFRFEGFNHLLNLSIHSTANFAKRAMLDCNMKGTTTRLVEKLAKTRAEIDSRENGKTLVLKELHAFCATYSYPQSHHNQFYFLHRGETSFFSDNLNK